VAETSGAVANEDAGHLAFDHTLVQVGEQTAEALSSPALVRGEQAHEWIHDHKTGIDLFDGMGKAGNVFREAEGTEATGTNFWSRLLYIRDDPDTGHICTESGEKGIQKRLRIGVGSNDDNAARLG
jgi:hypothetical protein